MPCSARLLSWAPLKRWIRCLWVALTILAIDILYYLASHRSASPTNSIHSPVHSESMKRMIYVGARGWLCRLPVGLSGITILAITLEQKNKHRIACLQCGCRDYSWAACWKLKDSRASAYADSEVRWAMKQSMFWYSALRIWV